MDENTLAQVGEQLLGLSSGSASIAGRLLGSGIYTFFEKFFDKLKRENIQPEDIERKANESEELGLYYKDTLRKLVDEGQKEKIEQWANAALNVYTGDFTPEQGIDYNLILAKVSYLNLLVLTELNSKCDKKLFTFSEMKNLLSNLKLEEDELHAHHNELISASLVIPVYPLTIETCWDSTPFPQMEYRLSERARGLIKYINKSR